METLSPGMHVAGKYVLQKPLARGAMGEVWIGTHASLGGEVAIKFLSHGPMHEGEDEATAMARFQFEARVAAKLSRRTRHIVGVTDHGEEHERAYLVMELVHGESLETMMRREGRCSLKTIAPIVAQVAKGLTAAHGEGVFHRDLKPANILLTHDEDGALLVKILDFGIAKLVAESGHTTQAIGSPLWMAPEQTNADSPITAATDVWALGLIAFTCLTGHSYWRGAHAEAPNPMTIVMEVCFDPLDPASKRAAEYGAAHLLPHGFDEWFAQCVSRDVNTRFSTARPVRAALERLLAPPEEPLTRVVDGAVASAPGRPSMEAPDLDIPAMRPKPVEAPKPVAAAKPAPSAQPKPAEAPTSRRSQPERIVIPPIKQAPAQQRISQEPLPAAMVPAPVNWKPFAIGGVLLLVGLFAAQRLLWTKPAPHDVPAATPSVDEPKKAPPKPGASGPLEKCPAGMARVPAGELVVGDPMRAVEPFCIDTHETTVKSYAACVKSGKCTAPATLGNWVATTADEKALRNQSCNYGRRDRDEHPINCVDWNQADGYCKANNRRLPTDIEWEWAARSGPVRYKYPWGSEAPDVQLCWSGFQKRSSTCAVGSFPKGADSYGVHDLAGNVREWTSTILSGSVLHCGSDWTDKGPDELFKLGYCGQAPKTAKSSFLGFRCAL